MPYIASISKKMVQYLQKRHYFQLPHIAAATALVKLASGGLDELILGRGPYLLYPSV